ncbi:MAG: prephenate dehydrogenase [Methanobrevibacter sp.]|uniref:prephenate dehydrogenase n=1 Tax=Methanobrevibacter sp. TaxID=66852 RepID=UPI0025EFE809|nr:prephenate dehydrogenase [Methanobrevibacter sp.]MBQ2652475.1 prephenate dehydrogenase [Methanobrevibacter sp.]MBQ2666973.1 prephenate dehydrogenase [Methanobrevibacter sp.]
MIKMNVGIIGGSDGLGKTLIYYFRDEFDVYITGRDHKKGRAVAEEMNVNYIESNAGLANISDMLVISVPIQHTCDVIREVAPFMKEGSVMVDVTSVKEGPSKTMAEVLPDSIEYIPTHPIFGPRTTRLDNQVIVLTPDAKGKWYSKVYEYLKGKNMRIIETTAEKHDFMMSIVQVLTHFSFISTASAIEKLKVDISETEDYESPIYNLMIDMIARIVSQNPYLTYNIQSMNTNGPKVRNTFAEAVIELRDAINNKDDEKFMDIAINATKHMGDITNALGRSDKAIGSLNYEYGILFKSIGKEVGLKHIYSGKIHTGILESVDGKSAVLKKGSKTEKLRIANIRILLDDELYQWKIENEDKKTESISCIFSKNVHVETIQKTVMNLGNIIDVKLIDAYNGPQIDEDSISLTFEVTALSKADIENVKNLFTGFGGIIR